MHRDRVVVQSSLNDTNSASVLDRQTTFWRLLDHDNRAKLAGLSTANTYPLVDREVSTRPAKSGIAVKS